MDQLNQRLNDIQSLINHERGLNQKLNDEKMDILNENEVLTTQLRELEITSEKNEAANKRTLSFEKEVNEVKKMYSKDLIKY